MTQPNTITVETRGAIEILTLNRPRELNAVTPEMIGELTDYFVALHDRPAIRVVILRGNGREFCAGAELGSDAFAAPGKGRAQRQLRMQQNYSAVIRLCGHARNRSSGFSMAPRAAQAFHCCLPATSALPHEMRG